MIKKLFVFVLLLSAGSLLFHFPQPFQFISGVLQSFFLPGLVFVYLVLGARVSRPDRIFLSILLSPILLSILLVIAHRLTGDIYLPLKTILAACYILLVAALVLRKNSDVNEAEGTVPKQIFILSFIYGGLIFLSYLVNNYLLIRADAWYHAAVVREIIERGIPPKEPFVADIPIKYMWFYHLFQAVWVKLSGSGLFWAMGFFNIINAFMFPYFIARFVMYFTDKKHVIVIASLLTIAGLDAVSWIFWPTSLLRILTGELTGLAELKRIISTVHVNGTNVIYFLAPYGTWPINFSDKFLTITIFGYSFNLFLAAAIFILREKFLEDARFRSSIMLFTVILGAFLFHVVTGITLACTIVGSIVLMYLGSRYIYRDDRRTKVLSVLFIATVPAVAIGMLYFLSLVSVNRSPGGDFLTTLFHFGYVNVITILFPLIILFFPARDAFKKLFSGTDYISRTVVYWILCLLVVNIFINIGTVGENKFIYLLFLIIGPPIYVQIVESINNCSGVRRNLLVAAVCILFFVPPIMTFRGFMMETPTSELGMRRSRITNEDRQFFDWIENNTPGDAVIIENNIYHLSPVYAGRRNFYSWQMVVEAFYGGEKIELYRHIQTSLFGKDDLSPEIVDKMKGFKQKLYVAVWKKDIESGPWLAERFNPESGWFKEEYDSDGVSLYSLK